MKHRKLRVHILIIFLALLSFSSATIIGFTYTRNYKSILHFAKVNMERVSSYIIARIQCLLHEFERLPQMAVGIYQRHPGININNQELIDYFLETVKFHPHLYAFYAGTPDGSFLAVFNLPITGNSNYFGSQKKAPAGAVYAMIVLDRIGSVENEIWSYLDADLKVISSETIPNRGYDPRIRPWYAGAEKTGELYWTDVFIYDPTNDPGIAVAKPIYDKQGKLLTIIGADLSLNIFSDYLTEQKIGRWGRAFILDPKGIVIVPNHTKDPLTEEARPFVADAFVKYKKIGRSDFILEEEENDYLASIHPFNIAGDREWLIGVIDPLDDFFEDMFKTQHRLFFISILILLLAAALVAYYSNKISEPIVELSKEVRKIQHLDFDSQTRVPSNILEINLMDSSIAAMRAAIRSFSRYIPKEVVKQLIEQGHEITLGGENKEVTIFFSDITDFTKISETLSPEQINLMLADYFEILSNIILANHGTIDKYLGDGIMAFWGAPEHLSNPTATACLTALVCQHQLTLFNQHQMEVGAPVLFTRIGINIGQAIIGNIGTTERMNYTALGDIVNTTSRLQSLNKDYRTKIIIGEKAARLVETEFLIRPLDYVEIRGKKGKERVFELVGIFEGPPELCVTDAQKELCTAFAQAYEAYHAGKFEEAKTLFSAIQAKFPEDYPTLLYLERLKKQV